MWISINPIDERNIIADTIYMNINRRRIFFLFLLLVIAAGLFLFLQQSKVIDVALLNALVSEEEAPPPPINADIEPQQPLLNPPAQIKAIYLTNWSAGSQKKLDYVFKLIKDTELNAAVIDIKDFSGYVGYNTDLELPKRYDAIELRIPYLNKLIKRFHDEGIYLIGRISVFQDQQLAIARPDLALRSSSTQAVWRDYKGLTWLDAASQEVWDYNIAIAQEILDRGFDEANFDYIRFASDGKLSDIVYPFWDETTLKTHIIRDFFRYLREQLPDAKLSADLFGLITVNTDGLGIGQHLEYALPYFDAIAPMVYPSHYFKNFIGYQNPAEHPYEVVKYSLDTAVKRIKNYELEIKNEIGTTTLLPRMAKLRPWLQDFDLGADYDAQKVISQIQATYDAASSSPEFFDGWMIWNAGNVYTREALQ